MALTIETQLEDPCPAFNEQRLILSSTNSGQTGFEYIVTIRAANEGASSLGDPIYLRKSPAPNGYGVFDLAKIMADYVDTDFSGNIDEFKQLTKLNRFFYFETFAEWDSGNEVGETGTFNGFNGVISVEDWVEANYTNWSFFMPYNNYGNFLTNYPLIQKSKMDETGFVSFISKKGTRFIGAELVTNGNFDSNLTGWTVAPSAAWTWDAGLAKSTTTSTIGTIYSIYQTYSVTSGKYYEISFDLNSGLGDLEVTTGNYYAENIYAITTTTNTNYGTIKVLWKALSNSEGIGFHFIPSATDEWATIDNVSVREVEVLPFSTEIKTYSATNTLINTFVLKNTFDNLFDYNHLRYSINSDNKFLSWMLPAGAKNLNQIADVYLTTGSQPIVTTAVSYWTIKVKTSEGNLYGNYKCYLNTACSKYKSFRIHWLNKLGGYDSFTFDLASQEDINIQRNFYNRLMRNDNTTNIKSYGYTSREETQYHTQYKTAYSVTSNWLSEDESNMLAELMTSPDVYWEKDADNNKYIPINIKANTYRKQSKTNNNTKIFNQEFQFEVSYNEKIQGR